MKRLANKFGPLLKERWAQIAAIEIDGDESDILRIELVDVTKRDMRHIADELICSGYAESATVTEAAITLVNYDMLLGDADTIREAVTQLLEEYSYRILESERKE